MPSTSEYYSRLVEKIGMSFEIFKILYKLSSLDFAFFNISAMLL